MRTAVAILLGALLAGVVSAASCPRACRPAIRACRAEGIEKPAACRRTLLRQCRAQGVGACALPAAERRGATVTGFVTTTATLTTARSLVVTWTPLPGIAVRPDPCRTDITVVQAGRQFTAGTIDTPRDPRRDDTAARVVGTPCANISAGVTGTAVLRDLPAWLDLAAPFTVEAWTPPALVVE